MTPNVPLLRKTVEWVEEQAALPWYKRTWRQRVFFSKYRVSKDNECGSAMCVAGKIAYDAGWRPLFYGTLNETDEAKKGRKEEEVQDVARDLLGISEFEAMHLFAATNTAKQIRKIAEEIAGERL